MLGVPALRAGCSPVRLGLTRVSWSYVWGLWKASRHRAQCPHLKRSGCSLSAGEVVDRAACTSSQGTACADPRGGAGAGGSQEEAGRLPSREARELDVSLGESWVETAEQGSLGE